jgi:hypothetical protein
MRWRHLPARVRRRAVPQTEPERERHQEQWPGSDRRYDGAVCGHPGVPQWLGDRILQRQGCPCWRINHVEVARLVRVIILLFASPREEASVFLILWLRERVIRSRPPSRSRMNSRLEIALEAILPIRL